MGITIRMTLPEERRFFPQKANIFLIFDLPKADEIGIHRNAVKQHFTQKFQIHSRIEFIRALTHRPQ